jgi:hypothetical protein
MKSRKLLAVALAALLAGCYEFTAPTGAVDLLLTGTWSTGAIPSGSYTSLSIRAAGGQITGTGQEQQLCCTHYSFTISGDYSPTSGSFTIGVMYPGGETRTFDGTVQGPDSLVGSWVMPGVLGMRVVFYRQPIPPCLDSAPLLGTFDPAAPGFIVQFHDSVDAAAEASRLAALYGFTTTFVYQAAIKGFAADLSLATVAMLRCEPAVAVIEYDGVVTIN